jgi:GcrA cell cycle regulator
MCGVKAASDQHWSVEMQWTVEAVEDLKRLALEGRSASHISVALGVGSRNAVIGKASRIGIKLTGDGGRRAGASPKPRSGSPRAQWASVAHRELGARPGPSAILKVRPGSQIGDLGVNTTAWAFREAEVGEMARVRFDEMREFACRWPLGDPRSGEFAYCGLTSAKGQSYCAGHCRMAYRPPNARARPGERRPLQALAAPWALV